MPAPQSDDLIKEIQKGGDGLSTLDDTKDEGDESDDTDSDEAPSSKKKTASESEDDKSTDDEDESDDSDDDSDEDDSEDEDDESDEEEPRVPRSRFTKVLRERNALRSKIARGERKPEASMTDEEKAQLEEDKKEEARLERILARREHAQQQADEDLADEFIGLLEEYGAFDVKRVLKIMDDYETKTPRAAVKLYFKLHGTGAKPKPTEEKGDGKPKPKVPKPGSSGPAGTGAKEVDLSRPLSSIVEDAKKEAGL